MAINWFEIVKSVLFIIAGGLIVYYKTNPKLKTESDKALEWIERLRGAAVEYIDRAELEFEGTKRGGEKFEWVVDKLYSLLPAAVKPFISREIVKDIVQSTFDLVQSYAKQQLDRLVDKVTETDSKEGA